MSVLRCGAEEEEDDDDYDDDDGLTSCSRVVEADTDHLPEGLLEAVQERSVGDGIEGVESTGVFLIMLRSRTVYSSLVPCAPRFCPT